MKFLFFIVLLVFLSHTDALKSQGYAFHPRNKLPGLPSKLLTRWQTTKKPKDVTTYFNSGVDALRVTPQSFGGDPTGTVDSTKALQAALAYCLNVSTYTPGVFPFGARNAGGCEVDLDGGEFLTSQTMLIPPNISNIRIGGGSLIATKALQDQFLVAVGGECLNPQGSCNEDIGFPELFLDGSGYANGIQTNAVMGTTIGPTTYLLNFSSYGIQVNGGHEVMITETWLGETNFDFDFKAHGVSPKATAIEINSNDHYVLDSIVFSALIGLRDKGAANMLTGLHVWFPWNNALGNGAVAFYDTGKHNRYDGCYIDGSIAVFENPRDIIWTNGFNLGGHGILINGTTASLLQISSTEFSGGNVNLAPGVNATDVTIDGNLFTDGNGGRGSKASGTFYSATATDTFTFDFCDDLVFDNITSVRHSFTQQGGKPTSFPVSVAATVTACDDASQNKRVNVYLSEAAIGTMVIDVDSSFYVNSPGQWTGQWN